MMAEMEAIDRAPEPSPARILDQRAPFLKRPVIDRMQDLVQQERRGQRTEACKEPGECGQLPLQQGKQWRQDSGKRSSSSTTGRTRLVLLRGDDRIFILDEHNAPAAPPRLLADAGERVVPGVLPVEIPQPRIAG